MRDPNFGIRDKGSILYIEPGVPRNPSIEQSIPNATNSYHTEVYVNKYGQKRFSNSEKGSLPIPNRQNFIKPTEVRYPAVDFNDHGFFNGFPFYLQEKNEYLNLPNNFIVSNGIKTHLGSGIANKANIDIPVQNYTNLNTLGGGFDLNGNQGYFSPSDRKDDNRAVSCNNFWNLAAIETNFVIQTRSMPATYTTGYAKNPDFNSTEGLQIVTEDFEVVNSYDEDPFLPHLRQYPDPTGETQLQVVDPEDNLINGSGEMYSSAFVHGHNTGSYADLFIPLTIQPENTGAFTITFDKSVAEHLESLPSFGTKKEFNCNMMFDFNIKDRDHEGFIGSNVEYHIFPYLAYIVPADGWDFTVVGSKVKGVYYTYEQKEGKRYAGDQTSPLNYRSSNEDISFSYSKHAPARKGGHTLNYNDAEYTHVPFEPSVSFYDGNVDKVFGYFFVADSNKAYLSSKLSTEGNDRDNRQTFSSSITSYPMVDSSKNGLSFFCGSARPELVLPQSVINKYYNKNYTFLEQNIQGKKTATGRTISNLIHLTRAFGTSPTLAHNKNPRKIKNVANRPADFVISSRVIGRKNSDYTQAVANKGGSKTTVLPSSLEGFPNTFMIK